MSVSKLDLKTFRNLVRDLAHDVISEQQATIENGWFDEGPSESQEEILEREIREVEEKINLVNKQREVFETLLEEAINEIGENVEKQ